jgi:hypothetical protein
LQFAETIRLAKQVLTAPPGAVMIYSEAATQTESEGYRVEVSGWDENQAFFVEKSDLGWDDEAGNHISLQRMLPDGAMVFICALLSEGPGQVPPNIYKVEFIGCDPEGLHQFRLNAVQPRHSRATPSVN